MASLRVAKILKVKTMLSDEEIAKISDHEGWKLIYQADAHKRPVPKRNEICFTGFVPEEKIELQTKALECGFDVVGSVTVHLAILVTGPEPGPVKLEKAKKQNTRILDLDQFNNLIETGELPIIENETEERKTALIPEDKASSDKKGGLNKGCLISLALIFGLLLFMILTPWLVDLLK